MASPNVEALRAGYERLIEGDTRAVLDLIDPEIEIHDRPEIPDPQVYRGHAGVMEALSRNEEVFWTLDFIPERFVEHGDTIVVVLRMVGRGRESGVTVEDHIAHRWTLRNGRAVRLQ